VTPTATAVPICSNVNAGSLTNGGSQLSVNLVNNTGGNISLETLHIEWVNAPASQRITDIYLATDNLWTGLENNPPSDFPADHAWGGGSRVIANTQNKDLRVVFNTTLDPGTYLVSAIFDINCRVEASLVVP
jgi:hypothetical protein